MNSSRVVDGAPVVDNIHVQGASLEHAQSGHEDGLGIGENGEEGSARIAELVDGEELVPGL